MSCGNVYAASTLCLMSMTGLARFKRCHGWMRWGACCCAGGNAYFGQKPTHELMVRWTQLNGLVTALQFSIAPWDLSEETAKLCAQAVALRKKVCTTAPADVPFQ